MNIIQKKLFFALLIALTIPLLCSSQDSKTFDLNYDVYRNYPSISITKEALNEAKTLTDLNKYFKPSWIREYISVEILSTHSGKIRKTMGENDKLNQEQIDIMNNADVGTDIEVNILYMPENTLVHNDPKEFNFTFAVEPDDPAEYVGGQQQLKQYLKNNIVDKISETSFRKYQLAAVKFTIDEVGQVINPHIFWTSEDENIDDLLLESICGMPKWMPAEYSNGMKVKQDYVLTIGDMQSCVVNLLNIRQNQ